MNKDATRRRKIPVLLLLLFALVCWSTHGATALAAQSDNNDGGDDDEPNLLPPADAALQFPLHEKHGTQHVNVWIGQPPVRQTLIVDTGSRYTATPCEGCVDCGRHANAYLPAHSYTRLTHVCDVPQRPHYLRHGGNSLPQDEPSSSLPLSLQLGCRMAQQCAGETCEILQKYTEGSTWRATEVNDIVAFDPVRLPTTTIKSSSSAETTRNESVWDTAVAYSFGCQTQVKGLFRKQYADGILGLLRTEHSVVHALTQQGLMARPSFSLCLHPDGGWLALGCPQNHRHVSSGLQFTPIPHAHAHPWYSIVVHEVRLGDIVLAASGSRGTDNSGDDDDDINDDDKHRHTQEVRPDIIQALQGGKGVVLDSGTTDIYLPVALKDPLAAAWKTLTGLDWKKSSSTWRYTYDEFMALPSLHLLLQGNVTLTLETRYYMEDGFVEIEAWNGTREFSPRIKPKEEIGAVLGFHAMAGYDFYFEETRVGIAPADCR